MCRWKPLLLSGVSLFLLAFIAEAESKPSDQPAFELILMADGFGTFMPINNQFRLNAGETPTGRGFQSGFFLQLGKFSGQTVHEAEEIYLMLEDSHVVLGDWNKWKWIDILCGAEKQADGTFPETLSSSEAQDLLPTPDGKRLLHSKMDPRDVVLITLWKGKSGLSLDVSSAAPKAPNHEHDAFTFKSKEPCVVSLYEVTDAGELALAAGTAAFDPELMPAVRKVVVQQWDLKPQHGGVHQPPWERDGGG